MTGQRIGERKAKSSSATVQANPPKTKGKNDEAKAKSLVEIWQGLNPTRQASCWSWLAFGTTWAITRLITHHGRGSGTSAAILIAGHHIHHYLMGIILMGITSAVAIFIRPDRWWQLLGVCYGVALALIMDEYALLLNLSDVYWAKQGRLSVDIVLFVIAVGGAYVTAVTWINEVGRRARTRVRSRVASRRGSTSST